MRWREILLGTTLVALVSGSCHNELNSLDRKPPIKQEYKSEVKQLNYLFQGGFEESIEYYKTIKNYHEIKYEPIRYNQRLTQRQKKLVSKVQENLTQLNYLQESVNEGELDTYTIRAINQYRKLNAIRNIEYIDSHFINHLNIPIKKRIGKLEEVLRESNKLKLSEHHIIINIPEFKLRFYANRKLEYEADICVGKQVHEGRRSRKWHTNIQRGKLKYATVNSMWYIPSYANSNVSRLGAKRRRAMGIYWSRSNKRWIQKAGPKNDIGRIIYEFGGGYGEPIHGTLSRDPFEKNIRAVSHGCIRIKDEIEFFRHLQKIKILREKCNLEKLLKGDSKGRYQTRKIWFKNDIKVNVVYLLGSVNKLKGKWVASFPNDIYNYKKSRIK